MVRLSSRLGLKTALSNKTVSVLYLVTQFVKKRGNVKEPHTVKEEKGESSDVVACPVG